MDFNDEFSQNDSKLSQDLAVPDSTESSPRGPEPDFDLAWELPIHNWDDWNFPFPQIFTF